MNTQEDDGRSQFLLAEYKFLHDSFWNTEKLGESLRTFFMSLVGAVVAGLGFFYKESFFGSGGASIVPAFVGLGALLVFGWLVLQRVIRRNIVSHKCLRAQNRIRYYFTKETHDEYLLYPTYDTQPFRKIEYWTFENGGIVQQIALVNSLVTGLIVVLSLLMLNRDVTFFAGACGMLVAIIIAWVFQLHWVKQKYFEAKRAIFDEDPIHPDPSF